MMDDFLQVILEETEKVFKPIINVPFDDDDEINSINNQINDSNSSSSDSKSVRKKADYLTTQENGRETTHQCKHCPQNFDRKTDLDGHMRKRHQDQRPFTCDQCEKRFSTKNILKQHERIHTKEKPYSCQYCFKRFSHRTALANHIRTHTGEKPFDCTFCEKSFGEKAKLLLHMRVHTGEKPFSCGHCQRAFRDKSSYNVHLRIHTGEKPFCCEYCQRCFTHRNSFKDHLRIHTGERPFVCVHCKRDFAKQSTLRKHLEVHGVVKPFELHLHAIIKPSNGVGGDPADATSSDVKREDEMVDSVTSHNDPEEPAVVVKRILNGKERKGEKIPIEVFLGGLYDNQVFVCVFCHTLYEDEVCLRNHLQGHPVESRVWKIGCDLIYLFTSMLGLDVSHALGFSRRDFHQIVDDFLKCLGIRRKLRGIIDPVIGMEEKLRSLFGAVVSKKEGEAIKLDRVDILGLLYDMLTVYPLCDDAK